MKSPLAITVMGVAAVILYAPVAQSQSQNCSTYGQVGMVEGTYEIPIHATAAGSRTDVKMQVAVGYDATIHLTVDKDGGSSATSDATITIHITGFLGDAVSQDLQIASTSSGELKTSSSSMKHFTLKGTLAGTGTQTGPLGGVSAGANGPETLTFEILDASCESASGTWRSTGFDGVVSEFKAKGFSVAAPAAGGGSWQVGESGKSKAEIDAIRDALKQLEAGAGGNATGDAQKLDTLLTKINSKPENLKKCLLKFWRETAIHVLAKDLAPKLSTLSAFPATGDPAELNALFEDALTVDKEYVRLGLDQCTDETRRPVFDALAAKTNAMVTRAIASGNTLQIMQFDKEFVLLSGVESDGGNRGWTKVTNSTAKQLEAAKKNLKALLKPLGQKNGPGIACSDAAVLEALKVECAAEKQLGILTGNPGDRCIEDRAYFNGACRK